MQSLYTSNAQSSGRTQKAASAETVGVPRTVSYQAIKSRGKAWEILIVPADRLMMVATFPESGSSTKTKPGRCSYCNALLLEEDRGKPLRNQIVTTRSRSGLMVLVSLVCSAYLEISADSAVLMSKGNLC